jgi:hypothetical protein
VGGLESEGDVLHHPLLSLEPRSLAIPSLAGAGVRGASRDEGSPPASGRRAPSASPPLNAWRLAPRNRGRSPPGGERRRRRRHLCFIIDPRIPGNCGGSGSGSLIWTKLLRDREGDQRGDMHPKPEVVRRLP